MQHAIAHAALHSVAHDIKVDCCSIVCHRPYIHQLNMAASEVARLHGVPVIDLAGMVFGLEPRQYLQDQHHPNKVRF
jgi:hypothetical protein